MIHGRDPTGPLRSAAMQTERIALVFPGQGSQSVGMGAALAAASPAAAADAWSRLLAFLACSRARDPPSLFGALLEALAVEDVQSAMATGGKARHHHRAVTNPRAGIRTRARLQPNPFARHEHVCQSAAHRVHDPPSGHFRGIGPLQVHA